MSDIASNREKIQAEAVNANSPNSQYLFTKLGGSINEILDGIKLSQEFTTSGSHSWTSPLTGRIFIEACGGGGGGGCYGGGSPPYGTGGGAGCQKIFKSYQVTKGTIYPIIIGSGGAGAPNGGAGVGSTGGNTTFDGVVISKGAPGGGTASGSFTPGFGGGLGSSIFNKGGDGLETGAIVDYKNPLPNIDRFGAGSSELFSGGAYGGNNGGGGASSYGNGGNGSSSGTGQAGQGYGAGGGASGTLGPGGDGASGYLAIYYV